MKHLAKLLVFTLVLALLLCVGGAALAADDYLGVWEYDDYYLWVEFSSDGTWTDYTNTGRSLDGYYEDLGDSLQLYLFDGTEYIVMTIDGTVMTDDDGDTLFQSSLPAFETSEMTEMGAVGVWEYIPTGSDDDMQAWIVIYEDDTCLIFDEYGLMNLSYARALSSDTVGLYDSEDDDDSESLLELTITGDSAVDTAGEEFFRSELPYDTVPAAGSDLVGVWEYDDYYLWYEFCADGSWYEYTDEGLLLQGVYAQDGGDVQLYLIDGYEYVPMVLDGDVLTEDDGDTMFRSELPEFTESTISAMGAAGVWYLGSEDFWLQITDGGEWLLFDDIGIVAIGYTEAIDDSTVSLYNFSDDEESLLELTVLDEDTIMGDTGEILTRGELPDYGFNPGGTAAAAADTDTAGELSGYSGMWEYDDYNLWLEINDANGTFTMYDEDGVALTGTLAGPDEDGSVDLIAEGETVTVTLVGDTLIDWDGDTLFRSDLLA